MTHTYQPVTVADRTYIPVSDVTPDGTVEEKFIWAYIVPNQDTWLELSINGGKVHWCDWIYGIAFIDAWTSLTRADRTYSGVSKSDNTYSLLTTPTAIYQGVTK